jgi:hypothetical protein
MGAQTGDRVRALFAYIVFELSIEGILHLQNTKHEGVLVLVDDGNGEALVNAQSVEVIAPGARPADSHDNEDKKLFHEWHPDDEWRPVHDLDHAIADGLVCWECLRDPDFEEQTIARGRTGIRPFLDAGWQLTSEDGWRDNDGVRNGMVFSLCMCLQRDGTHLEVVIDEWGPKGEWGGVLQVYDEDKMEPEGGLGDEMFGYRTEEELRTELARLGLLHWITR